MEPTGRKTLYRLTQKFPPSGADYKSQQAKGRVLPDDATEEDRRSWDALSAWDTEEGARKVSAVLRSAKWIVRYHIPDTAPGVQYEPSPPLGHYDIRGDMEELDGYLDRDFKVGV